MKTIIDKNLQLSTVHFLSSKTFPSIPKKPIRLPVSANPGDGRIFDADGKIICWMGGAGLMEEAEILSRRDEIIDALNGNKIRP